MSAISIRQAVLADLEVLATLFDEYRQFYGRTSDVNAASIFLRDRFENGESVLFIAYQGENPVGFTQLYPSFSSVSLARIFVLNDLFVRPFGRKSGVGTRLLRAASAYANTVGAIRLSLSTANTNTSAQSLYEAAGWQRDDEYFTYELNIPG